MFEGNRSCSICRAAMEDKKRNFGVSMSGYTFVFCDMCLRGRENEIKRILEG